MSNDGQLTGTQEDVHKVAVFDEKDGILKSIFPKFSSAQEEREYLKHRLAQAFRIFGHNGYDEGVAGHITVRVSVSSG